MEDIGGNHTDSDPVNAFCADKQVVDDAGDRIAAVRENTGQVGADQRI